MLHRLAVLGLVAMALACSKDNPTELEPLVVTISPSNPTLTAGQELQLQATISRGLTQLFEWESDFTQVATVSLTGVVTALSPGSALIKASWSADTTVFTTTRVTVDEGVHDRGPTQVEPPR